MHGNRLCLRVRLCTLVSVWVFVFVRVYTVINVDEDLPDKQSASDSANAEAYTRAYV